MKASYHKKFQDLYIIPPWLVKLIRFTICPDTPDSPVESILESLCDGGEIRGKSDDSAVVLHHVQRDRLPKLVGLRQTRDGR